MLKFRKRRAAAIATDVRTDALQIRSLLEDPRLRAVMGDAALVPPATPIHLDWVRIEQVHRPRFGRRVLQRAA